MRRLRPRGIRGQAASQLAGDADTGGLAPTIAYEPQNARQTASRLTGDADTGGLAPSTAYEPQNARTDGFPG